MFPEMKGDMDSVGDMFSSMGSFTAVFGMDRLNFGTLIGFYFIESGNILGLGGAFFAAFIAISVFAKEEKDRTAEFLLSHPISRFKFVSENLTVVLVTLGMTYTVVFIVVGYIWYCKKDIR